MATELEVEAGGVWQVHTETSTYLIDLDHQVVLRRPGAVAGPHIATDGALVVVTSLEGDHQWLPLRTVIDCRVGHGLVLLLTRPTGVLAVSVSTLVQSIERMEEATHPATAAARPHAEPEAETPSPATASQAGVSAAGQTEELSTLLAAITAEAEPGWIDLRVLVQDLIWVDAHTGSHLVAEMGPAQLGDVIDFLHENAGYFLRVLRLQHLRALRHQASQDTSDAVAMARAVDNLRFALRLPEDWIDQTPLMRALRSQLAARS